MLAAGDRLFLRKQNRGRRARVSGARVLVIASWGALGVVGCGASAASSRGPTDDDTSLDGGRDGAAQIRRVEPLLEVACEVRTDTAAPGNNRIEVWHVPRTGLEGVLGRIRYESARFEFAVGEPMAFAYAEGTGFGLHFSAMVRAADVPLWIRSTRNLAGGMFRPGPKTDVALVEVKPEAARMVLRSHPFVDLDDTPIEDLIPCRDVVGVPPALVPSLAGTPVDVFTGEGLYVTPAPGRPPEEGLHVRTGEPDGSLHAVELERRAGEVRVELPSLYGSVIGWVKADAIRPSRGGRGLMGTAEASLPPTAISSVQGVICDEPVQFAIREQPTATADPPRLVRLGEVMRGTTIGHSDDPTLTGPDGWRAVQVAAFEGEALFVRTSDLTDCKGPSTASE